MIRLFCRSVLQCMATAPWFSARGLGTSIVSETLAAVTFMQRTKGQLDAFYLSCSRLPDYVFGRRKRITRPSSRCIQLFMEYTGVEYCPVHSYDRVPMMKRLPGMRPLRHRDNLLVGAGKSG